MESVGLRRNMDASMLWIWYSWTLLWMRISISRTRRAFGFCMASERGRLFATGSPPRCAEEDLLTSAITRTHWRYDCYFLRVENNRHLVLSLSDEIQA